LIIEYHKIFSENKFKKKENKIKGSLDILPRKLYEKHVDLIQQ